MEFLGEFNDFVILLLTLAFVSSVFQVLMKYRNIGETKKLPPGPWKLPLIGNLHQMAGGLPHHILLDMARKHGPHMHLQFGELPFIVISSARLAKEVYKTLDPVFNGRPQLIALKVMFYDGKDMVSRTYDDYWRQVRKIWSHELVNAKTVRSMAPVLRDEGERLISLARKKEVGESLNLTEAISQFNMSVVCRAAFGRVFIDQDEFTKLVHEVVELLGGFDLADLFPSLTFLHFLSGKLPRMLKAHKKIDLFLDGIIDEHIRSFESTKEYRNGEGGEEDLIDTLLRLKDTGNLKIPITNVNVKAIIYDLFVAGTETSATVAVWAMSELMRNPRVMEKVQCEVREAFTGEESIDETSIFQLRYLTMVVKETLRLHPPGPLLLPRQSMKDCVIDEFFIPSKTNLMVNAWAIGRDPDLWSDPESFIPERFENNNIDFIGNNFELIPFGAGKRICPGIALGLANTKLPLALLLLHFDWDLPADLKLQGLDMTETVGATARKKIDLCLIPMLHSTIGDRF